MQQLTPTDVGSTWDIGLGGKEDHYCAVVFFDLCNFTNIARGLETDQTLAILQQLFVFVGKTVTKYYGMIDKYPGDGVVVFFPKDFSTSSDDPEERALDCIVEVMYWFYDKMRYHHDLPRPSHSLELAVGMDAGWISIAHVGSAVHSELILLGDEVNSASKCQQAAKEGEVVIGDDAVKELSVLYDLYCDTGPAIDIVYPYGNARYTTHRFDWRRFLENTGSWIDRDAR